MSHSKPLSVVCVVVSSLALFAADAAAQHRGGGGRAVGHGAAVARSAPRGGPVAVARGAFPRYSVGFVRPRFISPRIVGVFPYRPYFYPYRPGITVGFYAGYGYGYAYPYAYPYPYYGYPYYPYPYADGYAPVPPGYVSAQPGVAYGGVRIEGAPRDAQVFCDGNYVGVAEDFDGPVQHLNLPAGPHQIEIRAAGLQPVAFDVNVQAGQTVSVHADIR